MPQPSTQGASSQVSRVIKATPQAIYQAFLDPDALAAWLPPDTMTGRVHVLDAREGGGFRISLTYQDPGNSGSGKTTADTDTVQGKFAELVPNEKIVWLTKFDSPDPTFAGEMKITWTFTKVAAGTEVTVLSKNIPPGINPADNEMGSRSSLQNLAAYLE